MLRTDRSGPARQGAKWLDPPLWIAIELTLRFRAGTAAPARHL